MLLSIIIDHHGQWYIPIRDNNWICVIFHATANTFLGDKPMAIPATANFYSRIELYMLLTGKSLVETYLYFFIALFTCPCYSSGERSKFYGRDIKIFRVLDGANPFVTANYPDVVDAQDLYANKTLENVYHPIQPHPPIPTKGRTINHSNSSNLVPTSTNPSNTVPTNTNPPNVVPTSTQSSSMVPANANSSNTVPTNTETNISINVTNKTGQKTWLGYWCLNVMRLAENIVSMMSM